MLCCEPLLLFVLRLTYDSPITSHACQEGAPPKPTYEVVGTLANPSAARPKWVSEVVSVEDEAALKAAILCCRYVSMLHFGCNQEGRHRGL